MAMKRLLILTADTADGNEETADGQEETADGQEMTADWTGLGESHVG
jgi:hypothetical protein